MIHTLKVTVLTFINLLRVNMELISTNVTPTQCGEFTNPQTSTRLEKNSCKNRVTFFPKTIIQVPSLSAKLRVRVDFCRSIFLAYLSVSYFDFDIFHKISSNVMLTHSVCIHTAEDGL